MFEISVEAEFCAAHALMIQGVREPNHGHNWRLTVTVAGPSLDADGLLLDFHHLEKVVHEVVRPFHNGDLNVSAQFKGINPSAENVALHIAREVQNRLGNPSNRVVAVRVTEAPGCSVVYRPQLAAAPGR